MSVASNQNLLGRLAASATCRELGDVGGHEWHVGRYHDGRLVSPVLPMLFGDAVWGHPLVAGAYEPDLCDRMRAAGQAARDATDELAAVPLLTGDRDAFPNNLIADPEDPDGFMLIDFGLWGPLPVGVDLAQLLVGEIQIGRRPATELAAIHDAVLPAYLNGLAAEACTISPAVVRRAHALQLLLFTGLSTIPFGHFDRPPPQQLHALAADRAALSRFSLDLAGI